MDRSEIIAVADQLLDVLRTALFIDPFYTIKLELAEGDYFCSISPDDKAALAWVIKLNPKDHNSIYDIKYSIVECLMRITCEPWPDDNPHKKGIIARLTKAFADLIDTDENENED